jgi:diguanylate cyclase (GGDEF)-like protein/PAS domain S-box-containing protein
MRGKKKRESRLSVVMEAADLDVWENDLISGKVIRKATRIFSELGYDKQETAASIDNIMSLVHPDDVARVRGAINDHLEGRSARYSCEFRIKAKSGLWVWYANHGKIVERFGGRRARHLIGVTYNVNERRAQEEQLKHLNEELTAQKEILKQMNETLHAMAMTDALTNLANRRRLIDRMEHMLLTVRRTLQFGGLLFIDSDQFKAVNDAHGHKAGDILLKEIAKRLVAAVRECDTVARLSGDEFVVMLENLGTCPTEVAEKIQAVADKILASLNQPYQLPSGPYLNSCSIGATIIDGAHQSFDELCSEADAAMYAAKQAGRNSFRMFGPDRPG